jgi:hypothetical protein
MPLVLELRTLVFFTVHSVGQPPQKSTGGNAAVKLSQLNDMYRTIPIGSGRLANCCREMLISMTGLRLWMVCNFKLR